MEPNPPQEDETPFEIAVHCPTGDPPCEASVLAALLTRVLEDHGRNACTLSVALVDDGAMSELHERFLGVSGPTDVLTFDLEPESPHTVDGEIVICVDVARREAAKRGHDPRDELLLYAVHGCLHLLGYDDQTAEDAAVMHAREDELLARWANGPVYREHTP
jgi:probable rRNA maturation factor